MWCDNQKLSWISEASPSDQGIFVVLNSIQMVVLKTGRTEVVESYFITPANSKNVSSPLSVEGPSVWAALATYRGQMNSFERNFPQVFEQWLE